MAREPIPLKHKIPSTSDMIEKLMEEGASLEDAVKQVRSQGRIIVEIEFGGKLVYFSYGRSDGEYVLRPVCNQGFFTKGRRICEEQMVPENYGQLPECYR
jgi:hypothetical protein